MFVHDLAPFYLNKPVTSYRSTKKYFQNAGLLVVARVLKSTGSLKGKAFNYQDPTPFLFLCFQYSNKKLSNMYVT